MRSETPLQRRAAAWWRPIAGVAWSCFAVAAAGAELPPAVQTWLQTQTNLKTWSAQVVQTRTLPTLTQPLQSTGQVWFSAPAQFRWEIGAPPKTIAVRQPTALLVVYPRLKRAERYAFTAQASHRWKDMVALFDAGFPKSRTDLEERFELVSHSLSNEVFTLRLQPRSGRARRWLPSVSISFTTNTWMLCSTEMQLTDGSILRSQFLKPQVNPPLDPELFQFRLPPDYQVTEPLDN